MIEEVVYFRAEARGDPAQGRALANAVPEGFGLPRIGGARCIEAQGMGGQLGGLTKRELLLRDGQSRQGFHKEDFDIEGLASSQDGQEREPQ